MPTSRTAFIRVGEYGFTFQLKSAYKATGFDSATMYFVKPDGTVSSKTCDDSDGGNGLWGWVVTEDFFDTPGLWMVSLKVDLGSSGIRKSVAPAFFLVGDDLQ